MNTQKFPNKTILWLTAIIFSFTLGGCATVATDPRDPWEGFNRGMQGFNDTLDDYAMKPIAKGYRWITPDFIDIGITNFFDNIRDIRVTINDLLQLKFKQGAMDTGRFLVNSTVGIAGFIDVATMIDLPKHDEDFDQTLGYWGVPTGPYLVLPFFGPSSPRGTVGLAGDAAMNPLTYSFLIGGNIANWAAFGAYTVDVIDRRANVLTEEKIATEAALDRYEFFRDSYFQRRKYLINDGEIDDDDFDLDEDIDLGEDLGGPIFGP
jgi:phospholipid-binding lipoprotein MlaA